MSEAPAARPDEFKPTDPRSCFEQFLAEQRVLPAWVEGCFALYNMSISPLLARLLGPLWPHFSLQANEWISANEINIYRQEFNFQRFGSYILSASYSRIEPESTGLTWTGQAILQERRRRPHLLRWMQRDSEQRGGLPLLIPDEERSVGYQLNHDALGTMGIRLLIFPINLKEEHWTSVHVDLEHRTVEYFDSFGSGDPKIHPLIWRRLHQVADWMNGVDGDETEASYQVLPEASYLESPSQIKQGQQWDGYNCGCFLVHYAYLRALGLNSQQVNDIPFAEMQRAIRARRQEMLYIVDRQRNLLD